MLALGKPNFYACWVYAQHFDDMLEKYVGSHDEQSDNLSIGG
jgi:hypothetical protein